MGNFGFWTGIGAAQAAAKRGDGKPIDRRYRVISIIVGILLTLLIAAGLLFLLSTAD
jgi:hypothetical protein